MRIAQADFKTGTVSATTDIGVLDISHCTFLCYQANITGSIFGTLQLWVSNDGVNYSRVTDADQAIVAPQNAIIEVVDICSYYAKFVIAVTSGSGSVELLPYAKGNS
jgi:hypothetical protein